MLPGSPQSAKVPRPIPARSPHRAGSVGESPGAGLPGTAGARGDQLIPPKYLQEFVGVDQGRLWIAPRYRWLMASMGLMTLDGVMNDSRGRLLRYLPARENWRLEQFDSGQGKIVLYLKKHHVRTWVSWLNGRIGTRLSTSAGVIEAQNAARLTAIGVDTMQIVACGEAIKRDGTWNSFVLSQELTGFIPLDEFLKVKFSAAGTAADAAADGKATHALRKLVNQLADAVARLHTNGFNHRDLYCCHWFVREEGGEYQLRLIDLQRVQYRRWFRYRWLVKDLAQLAYSAPKIAVSRSLRMAFFRRYLSVNRLRAKHKRFLRRILGKQLRMERRLGESP